MNIRRRTGGAYPLADSTAQPVNILEKIVWAKEEEVVQLRAQIKPELTGTEPPLRNFCQALRTAQKLPALIAEVKKASPSKGLLRADFDPVAIAKAYAKGGADCLSVLTDSQFFQGSFTNLRLIRQAVDLPLLCKEFIIDPVQVYWARQQGADAILLITAILNDVDLHSLHQLGRSLGMTVLVEVHTLEELERTLKIPDVELIGINNRNLTNFTVDLQQTNYLLGQLPSALKGKYTWVSESGIFTRADLDQVQQAGVQAVLVGESLIKQSDLIQAIGQLYN